MKRFKRFIVSFVIVSLMLSVSAGVFAISGKEKNISLVTFYDFVQNADKAVWQSGAGYLQFPGSASDSRGFALWQTNGYMEDNKKYPKVLETHPEWKANGYIMATYPNLAVPTGAKLSLRIGFLKGATGTDGVLYRVLFNYTGQPINIFEKYKSYTGKVETETIDLSKYQGKNGKFILYVNAGGKNSAQDWAGWAEAEILYTKKYPDLVITDLWNKSGVIHYKIKNIGDAPTAPKTPISFTNILYLNNKSVSQDTITQILNPNEEIERSFGIYSYQPPQGTHTLKICADVSQSIDESNEGNNCLTKTISPGGIKVDTGCKDAKVEIYNSSEKLVISGYSNKTNTYSTGLILAPDNYKVVPSKKNCTFTPSYKLVSVVSNQVVNVAFQCSCKKADLVITEITRLKTGRTIQYKVKNQGSTGTESYFYNALYINENFIIKDYVKIYIKAGEELSREFSYSYTPTPPKDTVRVCTDSDKNIEEENEENNCLEVTWYTEEKLPDLIINEIKCDRENGRIGYVLKNICEETAKGGHSTTLFVNGKKITHDLVSADLKPGMTYSSWFKEYKWPESEDIRVKICADDYSKLKESNEQNNYLEKTCKCPADTTPPKVTITYSPSKVTTADEVNFTAHATDNTGVNKILIFINDKQVKECTPGTEKTDKEGRKYWECKYTGGPYDRGPLTYRAEAIDANKNRGLSEEKTIDVTISIQQPPVTLTMCFISGKIYGFPYDSDTLKIKICEAKKICDTDPITGSPYLADPVTGICPHTHLACDPDGTIRYLDVSPVYIGEFPSYFAYSSAASCTGTYMVMPVYQPYEYECEWKGSWDPDKYIIEMEGAGHSRCDFTFEPSDQHPPDVRIEFSNDEPEANEDVEIRILAEDDKGIASAFVKIDRAYHDGSSIAGNWREVGITRNFDDASGLYKATAIELFSEDGVKTIVVRAKVCDVGGNGRFARKTLSFGCLPIDFTFPPGPGGRMATSSMPIFGFPDEDEDGINDCWENAAMEALNPWIELDEEDNFLDTKNRNFKNLFSGKYVTLNEMKAQTHKVVNFVRVTPYPKDNPKYILFYYIVSWSKDYGKLKFDKGHNGDTEPLIMAWGIVENSDGRTPDTIQLECIYINAHGDCNRRTDLWEPYGISCNRDPVCTFNDEKEVARNQETCAELEFSDNRLYLYASENKHCLYPACQACETVTLMEPDWSIVVGDWLGSIANIVGSVLRLIGRAILWVVDQIVSLLTWWKDDHLDGVQVAVLDYPELQDINAAPPFWEELKHSGVLIFKGGDYEYLLGYHVETDFTNEERPHVRIVVDNLYCVDETDPEELCTPCFPNFWNICCANNWVHDEPYVIITGFSVYPEGVTTWPVGQPRFGEVDDNENREINSDVFNGEINPYYTIGFTASLFEDDGRATSADDRRNEGNNMAERLGRKLRGEEEVGGECGEHLLRRIFNIEIGEDRSGGGV